MEAVNYAELEELAGEFLPERMVLSTVTPNGPVQFGGGGQGGYLGGGDGGSSSSSAAAAGGGDGGQGLGVVQTDPSHFSSFHTSNACTVNQTPESNSGLLGLFTSAQQNTSTCLPGDASGTSAG